MHPGTSIATAICLFLLVVAAHLKGDLGSLFMHVELEESGSLKASFLVIVGIITVLHLKSICVKRGCPFVACLHIVIVSLGVPMEGGIPEFSTYPY